MTLEDPKLATASHHGFNPEALPPGWKTVRLADIALSIQYGHTASAMARSEGPRFLRITDIQDGKVDWDSVPSCDISTAEVPKYRLADGDIVFARTGATTGKSFLISNCPEAVFASYLIRLRIAPEASPRYVHAFFQSASYWRQIETSKRGIGQPNVNGQILSQLTLPLPPLDEQQRIVAEIEKQFTRLEAGVVSLKRVQAALKRYRASVLKAACEGRLVPTEAELARRESRSYEPATTLLARILSAAEKNPLGKAKLKPLELDVDLGALPDGWTSVALERIAEVVDPNPKHRNPKYVDKGFPFLSTAQFSSGDGFELATAKTVAEETVIEQETRCHFSGRSIAFSRKGTIGKTRFLPTSHRFALLDSLCVINPSEVLCSKYLNIGLNAPFVQKQIQAQIRGVALKQISVGGVRDLRIPLPPLAEQHRIVAEVERRLSVIEGLETVVAANLQRAARLRQSILHRAFSGTLLEARTAGAAA